MRGMGEFRQDRSHPQYRGHLPLYATKKNSHFPGSSGKNAKGEGRAEERGIVRIVIRWR